MFLTDYQPGYVLSMLLKFWLISASTLSLKKRFFRKKKKNSVILVDASDGITVDNRDSVYICSVKWQNSLLGKIEGENRI